ncbi:MAG: sulfite exporter TauE/SafE family protein [Paracoccaceae bacterium]
MESLFSLMSPLDLLFAGSIAVFAGFVKGTVGFAMPMVLVSGLNVFLQPDLALALLILPTLFTNIFQATRQGLGPAWQVAKDFWIYLVVGGTVLVAAAQLVRVLPPQAMLLIIGIPVTFFALLMLVGAGFHLARRSPRLEAAIAAFAGFLGGLSGIWGPPTVMYLTALGTEKHAQMRVQGVIYGLGSVSLAIAHVGSGVLNQATWPMSAALVPPAFFGMWLGGLLLARIDQKMFRRATLLVLLVAGLNLVRRAIWV